MCYDLIERREENNQMTTRALTNAFNVGYFPNTNDYVSTAAVQRFFDSIDISRKTNERRHIRQNPIEAYHYLCKVESLDYTKAKDTDEASMTPKQFEKRFGYAPKGDVSEKTQIVIGGRSFSVICMLGYLCVEVVTVHEGSINSTVFKAFIEEECTAVIDTAAGEWGIYDNASMHKQVDVKLAIDHLFRGNWSFVPPYSPFLEPVEHLFALVKQFLRDHEDEARAAPEAWIYRAFARYEPGGSQAHVPRHTKPLEQIQA
jgi:transposase